MDELVKLVADKASISESQAKKAVETVAGFLKDKLPPPFDDQIEKVLEGKDVSDSLGGLMKGLGGLLD